MNFRTYNQQGQVLLDSEQAVFSFIKSGRLTRLFATPFESNKREYWYRAKRLGINSKMRQGWADIHTKEYCMYYIDVPNAISPLATVYYDGLAKDCNPVIYINSGQFNGITRMMFYSNGRLSDEELAKFHIYVFDVNVIKETHVGMNLYDRNGNVTFSNRSKPMLMTPINIKGVSIKGNNIRIENRQAIEDIITIEWLFDNFQESDPEYAAAQKRARAAITPILNLKFSPFSSLVNSTLKKGRKYTVFGDNTYNIRGIPNFFDDGGYYGGIRIYDNNSYMLIDIKGSAKTKLHLFGSRDLIWFYKQVDFKNINTNGEVNHNIASPELHNVHLEEWCAFLEDTSILVVDVTDLPFPYN